METSTPPIGSDRVFSAACGWLCVLIVYFLVPTSGNALDLSGIYADKGVKLIDIKSATVEPASFHALLGQELNRRLADLNFRDTSSIRLTDKAESLGIQIVDKNGDIQWEDNWSALQGFSHEGEVGVIRMQSTAHHDDRFVLVLKPLPEDQGLEVNVYRVKPSFIGPFEEPLGVYVFARES